MAMFELDFCGFASLPGNVLAECLDAAGVDATLDSGVLPGENASRAADRGLRARSAE
jgi:hypothetical protein